MKPSHLLGPALALVLQVQLVEVLSPDVRQAGRLVGAHEGPVLVGLHALHEQVVDPQAVEQVAGARLLLAVVLAQVQPVEDVRVPGLHVDGKGALALAAALVDVPAGSIVQGCGNQASYCWLEGRHGH